MRTYKFLCLTLTLLCGIFMVIASEQDQTIEQQQGLIRRMETNKSCMVATGGNNEPNSQH
jgi:hypothetical protein